MRYAFGFGLLGLVIAAALAIYALSLLSHGLQPAEGLFLILCPASLSAMPLGHSAWSGELKQWLLIMVENAALYAIVGLLFGAAAESSGD